MCDLGQNIPYLTFDIASCPFEGNPTSLTLADPYLPLVLVHFSHRLILKVSLPFQISIRDFPSFCPQAIFPAQVALFPSGMLYMTNIPSRYQKKRYSA